MNIPSRAPQIAAYFPEWGVGRGYTVKSIADSGAAERITIINYAFGIPSQDAKSGDVVCSIENPAEAYARAYGPAESVDGVADSPTDSLRGHFQQLRKLKSQHQQIRVVISLGGWTGSGWFSDAAVTEQARQKFVASCLDLYLHGNLPPVQGAGGPGAGAEVFDGIDIDWEYPVQGGLSTNHTRPEDAENFVLLLREFRAQLKAAGRPDFLLTMAGPGPGQAGQYNLNEAHPLLDYVAVMTYDFRGAWSSTTGHHTNLCASQIDPAPAGEQISADRTMRIYRDAFGVPAEKLLLGAAFYGKAWKEVGAENHGLFQSGTGMEEGNNGYRYLKELPETLGFERHWDEGAKAPWLYHPSERLFWTYDDEQSMALKAAYVRFHGLGGVMFWDITGDDAEGTLVRAISETLNSQPPEEDPCR